MNKWEFLKDYISREMFRCGLVAESPVVNQNCKDRYELRAEVLRQVEKKMREAEERDAKLVAAGLREAEED